MQMKNQDYAYFQVIYYDVPAQVSLSHAFPGGTSTMIGFDILYTVSYLTSLTDPRVTEDFEENFLLYLDVRGVMNSEQIADRIRA
jgi:hypothetical protein